MYSFHIWL